MSWEMPLNTPGLRDARGEDEAPAEKVIKRYLRDQRERIIEKIKSLKADIDVCRDQLQQYERELWELESVLKWMNEIIGDKHE